MKKFPVEMKKSPFFEGIEDTEEEKVLKGLDAHEMTYDKENYILHCGEQVKEMGMLVSGGLLIVQEDFWGNRNLVAKIGPGDVFAETFACMQRRNINVNVIAEEAANVLWLNVQNILDADGETEGWKLVLLRNLLENMAEKNLRFNEKLTHMGNGITHSIIQRLFHCGIAKVPCLRYASSAQCHRLCRKCIFRHHTWFRNIRHFFLLDGSR